MRDTKSMDDTNRHTTNPELLANLEAAFSGRFEARPGNLTGSRLDLYAPSHSVELPPKVVVAELCFDGSKRATLKSGGGALVLDDGGSNAVVSLGDSTILRATRLGATDFEVSYPGAGYRAKLSPVRNTGAVRSDGVEVCRVKGSLFGRSYTATFREGMFPAAVFLMWQTALLRRRAFTVGERR